MDLTIAHHLMGKIEDSGNEVDDYQFQQLVHLARKAKHSLLGDQPQDTYNMSVAGKRE